MAEENKSNKEKEEIRENESNSAENFNAGESESDTGQKVKASEEKSPDDYDSEIETSDIKNAEQKTPDDFDEEEENSKKKSKKKKHTKKNKEEGRRIEELEGKYDNLNDKYLRLYSEFDNFRKRTIKEKAEFSKTANQYLIEDLLPVLDDFERAIKALNDDQKQESTSEGFILIYNKLKNTLKNKGLEEMDSKGKEFNTDFHDALTQIPAPKEDQKGKVVDVIEKGYLLNGKVIRYAKVVVGK